jgi:hypothetical protein
VQIAAEGVTLLVELITADAVSRSKDRRLARRHHSRRSNAEILVIGVVVAKADLAVERQIDGTVGGQR